VRIAIAAVRTVIWTTVFFIGSALVVVIGLPCAYFSSRALALAVRAWALLNRESARWILGQRVVVEGEMPRGAAFLVSKHEAMFETIDVMLLLDRPVVFTKKELFAIPFWGALATRYGLIPIERTAGASALRTMRRAAAATIAAGRPIILFPEGTRVPHGQSPSIRSGFAGVYKLLGMAAVPVAVDSGRLRARGWWGGWIRLPGTIKYRVGEVIPPGLPRDEAEALAHKAINALN
jgi:1-acyl-sn-glycerol-3-phosphate acyltransferase